MTNENDTEGAEPQEQSTGDSPVISELRKQIKDLSAELKSRPTRESVEVEVRTALERESAISEQLVALGHPTGMSAVLKGTLGDAEVTKETVTNALQGLGYAVEVAEASSESEAEVSEPQSDLAKVANLSAQVSATAQGAPSDDVMQRISQAKDQNELNALMTEIGLTAQ